MEEGIIWFREIVFGSDHGVYVRLSHRLDDDEENWETTGWVRKPDWKSIDRVRMVAQVKAVAGWQAVWNPAYAPGLQQFVVRGEL
jgi:hypothetical protein